ncbi:hypothetical protein HY768_04605 [candidate division TA06 bacterium]|uniref:Uncharacterized protein n=1 Tax=candidate division TA06 bacterium TaxID=2250710 RepID=A0A933IA35_UNCT6|nr:hypothetical protein [candidate division TA06 bacterium]
MKKTSMAFSMLAGLSFLGAILFKLNVLPRNFLNTVPSSYIQLAQLFLLAAIALGIHGMDQKK